MALAVVEGTQSGYTTERICSCVNWIGAPGGTAGTKTVIGAVLALFTARAGQAMQQAMSGE